MPASHELGPSTSTLTKTTEPSDEVLTRMTLPFPLSQLCSYKGLQATKSHGSPRRVLDHARVETEFGTSTLSTLGPSDHLHNNPEHTSRQRASPESSASSSHHDPSPTFAEVSLGAGLRSLRGVPPSCRNAARRPVPNALRPRCFESVRAHDYKTIPLR